MLDFITTFVTDPANVPLAGWIGAAAAVVAALVGIIALFRRSRREPSAVAKNHSFAAGRDQHLGDVTIGAPPEQRKD